MHRKDERPQRAPRHRFIALVLSLLISVIAAAGFGSSWLSRAAPALEGAADASTLPVEGIAPKLDGATAWLNSPPLTGAALRGKVVLVDFWTYSCVNCLRALPHVRAWADKYRDQGFVVVGVHAPEFDFEKDVANVRRAVGELGITYPVAVDSDMRIWRAFGNQFWPAHYFIDAHGRIRYHHFGEGHYEASERVIRELLAEAGHPAKDDAFAAATGAGVQMAPDMAQIGSPETYVGYARAERFVSPGGQVRERSRDYALPAQWSLNQWALGGRWTVHGEKAVLGDGGGRILYRFHARDLNLVLGPGRDGKPIRFRVRVDGQAPGVNHGSDVDADGNGQVTAQRLYQLVRSSDGVRDRSFEIEFLDPGVEAFAFTFG